jgi:glyoxylase-like metal-dependent hydrolase (beta-lactamase superfamily II)
VVPDRVYPRPRERDAILVDPLMTIDESRALADWVVATGKNVTAVFVTHAHGDHFFGAPAVLDRFPDAELVATPDVAPTWRPSGARAGSRGSGTPLPGPNLRPAPGRATTARQGARTRERATAGDRAGHTDTDGSSALHVPSIGLVVAGEAVHGDVHLYLAESKGHSRQAWLDALDTIEGLRPSAVVAGHKRDGDPDVPEQIGSTRRYIEDFSTAAEKAGSHIDLYDAIVSLYPDRVNGGVLWNSAKAAMS